MPTSLQSSIHIHGHLSTLISIAINYIGFQTAHHTAQYRILTTTCSTIQLNVPFVSDSFYQMKNTHSISPYQKTLTMKTTPRCIAYHTLTSPLIVSFFSPCGFKNLSWGSPTLNMQLCYTFLFPYHCRFNLYHKQNLSYLPRPPCIS